MSGTSALLALAKQTPYSWTDDKQHVQIGNATLHRLTKVPYKLKAKSEFYPLESIIYLLESEARKDTVAKYITGAAQAKITPVAATQRKELLAFLRGEASSAPDLDIAGLKRLEGDSAGAAGDEGAEGERAGKRQRVSSEEEAPPKPVAEWDETDIAREECILSTHQSVMLVPKKNFTNLLELYQRAMGEGRQSKTEARELKHKARQAEKNRVPVLNPRDPNYGIPIIVVPAALSAVVNMYNVKQLLENGIFESGEYMRVEKGATKENLLTITKASFYDPSKNVKYQVIDDVTQLRSEEDWHRVVAVFVLGAAWQFSDWPKKKWSNTAAIFENVCAFHLHFDDEALHPNITQWRTHRLPISKTKRHGDRSVVLDFWHILNEFIAARNATKKLNI